MIELPVFTSFPDFFEDFNTGDTGSVAANTDFESETDANSELEIVSGRMRYYASTTGRSGFVTLSSLYSDVSEMIVYFTINFSAILISDINAEILSFVGFVGIKKWGYRVLGGL